MPRFDRTEPVTVAVRGTRGHVDITAADGAAVSADVVPLEDSERARQAAEQTRVSLDGDTLTVTTPDAGRRWRPGPKLGITITVPAGSSLAVKLASADLRAVGRYAYAQVDMASGDAYLEDVGRDATLGAASGTITVNRVGGALEAHASSGDLRIGDVTGDVNATAASGNVSLRSAGGSLKAEAASGDIEIGALRRGSARVRTASGRVEVGIAAGSGVWLDVSTSSGRTTNDLSAADAPQTPAPDRLDLRIRTSSGDIRIRRAPGGLTAAHRAA